MEAWKWRIIENHRPPKQQWELPDDLTLMIFQIAFNTSSTRCKARTLRGSVCKRKKSPVEETTNETHVYFCKQHAVKFQGLKNRTPSHDLESPFATLALSFQGTTFTRAAPRRRAAVVARAFESSDIPPVQAPPCSSPPSPNDCMDASI